LIIKLLIMVFIGIMLKKEFTNINFYFLTNYFIFQQNF